MFERVSILCVIERLATSCRVLLLLLLLTLSLTRLQDINHLWYFVSLLCRVPDRLLREPRMGPWPVRFVFHRNRDWKHNRHRDGARVEEDHQLARQGSRDRTSAARGDSVGHANRRNPHAHRPIGILLDVSPRHNSLGHREFIPSRFWRCRMVFDGCW